LGRHPFAASAISTELKSIRSSNGYARPSESSTGSNTTIDQMVARPSSAASRPAEKRGWPSTLPPSRRIPAMERM
jgi:hypothetical protein